MSQTSKELGAARACGELHAPWTCREYGSPRGRYFIKDSAGNTVASSLVCGLAKARVAAAAPELLEALRPFAAYAKARAAMPIRGAGDTVHRIHPGTEWEAEITVADCNAALAAIAKADGAS